MDPAETGATMSTGARPSAGGRPGGMSPTAAKARFERLERRLRTIESCVTQEELELRREFKNRSEEHTSELQSLMRISYAVFCLKKKKTQYHQRTKEKRQTKEKQVNT